MGSAVILIGIDGGLTGAIAFIGGNQVVRVHDLPTVPQDGSITRRLHGPALRSMIRAGVPASEPCIVVLEQLSTGGFRGRENNHMSRESQAITHATIITTLELMGLRLGESIHEVTVQRWKKLFGLTKEKASDKKESLKVARELYPELSQTDLRLAKDHNKAEALLIAHWGLKVLA